MRIGDDANDRHARPVSGFENEALAHGRLTRPIGLRDLVTDNDAARIAALERSAG
jgi:hypothetical protein